MSNQPANQAISDGFAEFLHDIYSKGPHAAGFSVDDMRRAYGSGWATALIELRAQLSQAERDKAAMRWQSERPTSGKWWVALSPEKRGNQYAVRGVNIDGGGFVHAGYGMRMLGIVSSPLFDGARWAKRELPADPFATRDVEAEKGQGQESKAPPPSIIEDMEADFAKHGAFGGAHRDVKTGATYATRQITTDSDSRNITMPGRDPKPKKPEGT